MDFLMQTPNLKNTKLGGELSQRLEMAVRRLLREDKIKARDNWACNPYSLDYLLADLVMSKTEGSPCGHWAGDEAGRYINVLSVLLPFSGSLYPRELGKEIREKLDRVVHGVLKLQDPEGYFGQKREEGKTCRDHTSGHNWLLRGLVEYYNLVNNTETLAAAKKLGDHYVKTHPLWVTPEAMADIDEGGGKEAFVYSNYTHCIDGLVNLWRASKENKYLELAKKIAALIKPFEKAIHSHHYFSTLRGMINLYSASGDKQFLLRVEKEWDTISRKGLLPTEGAPEHYFGSWISDEGCSESDWAMINLHLWSATQNAKYIEEAEKVILNHFYWNQCANGGFSCNYGGGDFRLGKMGNHVPGKRNEAYWCCSMHCAFGLFEIAKHVITFDERTVWVNLFNNIESSFNMGGSEVKMKVQTLYPMKGMVHIEAESENPFELRIRVPGWLKPEKISLAVNGAKTAPVITKGFLSVQKRGKHFKLEMDFQPEVRVIKPVISDFSYVKSDFKPSDKSLICYGSLILRPVEPIEDAETIIIPDKPSYTIENGLLKIVLFSVMSPEDAADKGKWQKRIFEPISQETFHPLDITTFLFSAVVSV